jgi:hypothetical protein
VFLVKICFEFEYVKKLRKEEDIFSSNVFGIAVTVMIVV